jgi:hypothetical protein
MTVGWVERQGNPTVEASPHVSDYRGSPINTKSDQNGEVVGKIVRSIAPAYSDRECWACGKIAKQAKLTPNCRYS